MKFQLDYFEYTKEINRLKEKYSHKLEIYAGVEFGMQPHILDSDLSFFKNKDFDYVIGSIHAATKKELYGGDFLTGRTEHGGIIAYFEDMIYCVRHFDSYCNLGHLDAIARYIDSSFCAAKYRDYIEEVLRLIINKGKGIELNTSGKRYSLPHFHPEPSILELYRSLGGEIITLGSDSHSPHTLGAGFEEAKEVLKSCGFRYYAIYKNKKPEFIML